jgi:hypothetical protein
VSGREALADYRQRSTGPGTCQPMMRWQQAARVSRISSAVLAHVNGLGSLFHSLVHLRMPVSSSVTLRSR